MKFLDVACLTKGDCKNFDTKILDTYGFFVENGTRVLYNKYLLMSHTKDMDARFNTTIRMVKYSPTRSSRSGLMQQTIYAWDHVYVQWVLAKIGTYISMTLIID